MNNIHLENQDFGTYDKFPNVDGIRLINCRNFEVMPPIPPTVWRLVFDTCPSLTDLPDIPGSVGHLDILNCNNLGIIDMRQQILSLDIRKCNSLSTMHVMEDTWVVAYDCLLLTEIDGDIKNVYNCPFIKDEMAMNKLINLQEFAKRYIHYRRFKTWIRSREFAEWFYNPNEYGGIFAKRQLNNIFE